jgi:hypothetical protein
MCGKGTRKSQHMRQLSKTGLESRWAVELEGGGEKQDQSLLSWEIEYSTFNV